MISLKVSSSILLSILLLGGACSLSSAPQSEMSLSDHLWTWEKTSYNDDTLVVPVKSAAFTLALNSEGAYQVSTDCNGSSGDYTSEGSSLSFANTGVATLMFCEGSQENDFLNMLTKVQSYLFSSDGHLVLELEGHTGSMIFK